MNIAAFGGTGFLGRHVCRALMDRGHSVTVASRSPEKVGRLPLLRGAAASGGDVTDPTSLQDALSGAQAAFYAVQFPNYPVEQPRRGLTFDRYDRQGVENVIAAGREAELQRLLYVSGVGADSDSDKSWYRAKGRAEQTIRSCGLRYSILRPSWAYGPEDKALNKFRSIARFSPVVPKPGTRRQVIQPVHVDDIAEAAARIFGGEDAWDKTIEIGGPELLTMDEVMRTLFDAMGVRRIILPVPAGLLKALTAPLDAFPRPPMNPAGIEFAIQDGDADNTALGELLDLRPRSLAEGLRAYIGPRR